MANIYYNLYQTSLLSVVVNPIPSASPQQLIWTSGGSGLTTDGVPGTIFASGGGSIITPDLVTPPAWYYGGNPLINTGVIQFFDNNPADITITNTQLDIISGQIEKGIFELRIGNALSINAVTLGTQTLINITGSYTFNTGDHVRILGIGTTVPDGIYRILNVVLPSPTLQILIDYDSSSMTAYSSGGTVEYYEYLWDEVYTTPLGCYQAWDGTGPDPTLSSAVYFFYFNSNNSNQVNIYIEDPNIIPKVDDILIIQKLPGDPENPDVSYIFSSTTDGYNSVLNYSESETYQFTITSVASTVKSYGSNGFVVYTLILDKSFAPIMPVSPSTTLTQYVLVLLNRGGTTTNRELFTDTWEQTEVHRQQLTGDPYDYVGLLSPVGRSNYLNYGGAGFLGVRNMLSGIMPDGNTPFVILQYQDNVKDRISFPDSTSSLGPVPGQVRHSCT